MRFIRAIQAQDDYYVDGYLQGVEQYILDSAVGIVDESFKVFSSITERSEMVSDNVQDYPYCYAKDYSTVIGADEKLYVCCVKTNSNAGEVGLIPSNGDVAAIWNDELLKTYREFNPRENCKHKCRYSMINKTLNNLFNDQITCHDYFV